MNVYLMSVQLCGTGMHQINYVAYHVTGNNKPHGKGTFYIHNIHNCTGTLCNIGSYIL